MGSTVTIYNNTRFILNIALSQVGPLYYENMVKPGEYMRRNVGKVHFTVEARLWDNGSNSYSDEQVIMPIVIITVAALTMALGAFSGLAAAAGGTGAVVLTKITAGVGVIGSAVGVSEKTRGIIIAMVTGGAIKSLGWYMGKDRDICITGGPMGGFEWVNGTYFQAVDENTVNWPFNVEAC